MNPTSLLAIQSLDVGYAESPVVQDVSLDVPAGEVVCLMGRNGVGKTTLIKSIMGVLRPSRGQIFFGGDEITHWSSSQRARAGIGYVPQGRGIFPQLTVYENLLIGFEATPSRRTDRTALEEIFELFPMLKQFQQRAAGALSGGQQQQLAFARVLVRRPKLLLLDEPTEGIQPSIMAEIEDLIRSLHKSGTMTILLVEQFLQFAMGVGTAFYVMETGAIIMGGAAATFDAANAAEYLSF